MSVLPRLGAVLLASALVCATRLLALPGPVEYSPATKIIQGNQPLIALAAPDPVSPVNPYTLTIKSPLSLAQGTSLTVDLGFSIIVDPVTGALQKPAGVSDAIALGFIKATPSTITFTGPGQTATTVISVNVPLGSYAGDYGWNVKGINWPAGVTDSGATINATVLPPLVTSNTSPVVSIGQPADGQVFVYAPASGPISFPITFGATVAAGGQPINFLRASFDGVPLAITDIVGYGTLEASGRAQSPSITDGGVHTIEVLAQNNAGTGTKTIHINVYAPPVISAQPVNQAVFAGDPATFSVGATGTPAPTFQWLKNGVPISGATGATYAILSAGLTDIGNYSVTVSNPYGTLISTIATLAVQERPQASIGGLVYFDANVSQTREASEVGIGGIPVELRGADNSLVATTKSSDAGLYTFTATPAQKYFVVIKPTAGLVASTPTELTVIAGTAGASNLQTGLTLNFDALRGTKAAGFTIGYWKNNLSKAYAGQTTGTQQTADALCAATNVIRRFALSPFDDLAECTLSARTGLNQAVTVLASTSSDPAALLKKQLLASEYNFATGAWLDGLGQTPDERKTLTGLFIRWGEQVLLNAGSYGATYVLWAKDWFDAYNNSHGGAVAGPAAPGSTSLAADFNGTAIPAGGFLWFNAVVDIDGRSGRAATVAFNRSGVEMSLGGVAYNIDVPDTVITFEATEVATAVYDEPNDTWRVSVPVGYTGNILLGGVAVPLPSGLPGGIKGVKWSGRFSSATTGLSATWKWAAAAYRPFDDDLNVLQVKPIDGSKSNLWLNSDAAGTPEGRNVAGLFKSFAIGGARGGGGSNYTGSYSGTVKVTVPLPNQY